MPSRFTLPIAPTPADIDELGHVSNLVYLRWVLDIATAHSRSVGWDHPEYRALGAVFVVRRHEIDYVAQVKQGDSLVGETWVEDWKQASCIRKTELRRQGCELALQLALLRRVGRHRVDESGDRHETVEAHQPAHG